MIERRNEEEETGGLSRTMLREGAEVSCWSGQVSKSTQWPEHRVGWLFWPAALSNPLCCIMGRTE